MNAAGRATAVRRAWPVVGRYAVVAAALGIVALLSHAYLSPGPVDSGPGGRADLWAFSNWDAGWYFDIAERGYNYSGPDRQSSVAYFPAYPALMRAGSWLVGDPLLAGVLVTYVAGLIAALGVHRTATLAVARRQGKPDDDGDERGGGGTERVARAAVVLFLVSPFAYYFFGVVYADALFVAACVWGLLLFRANHLIAATAVGAVATAARPLGLGLTVALGIAALVYRPDGTTRQTVTFDVADLRARLPRLLAAAGTTVGLGGYLALLWWRFGDPFAFAKVGGALGWNKGLSWARVIKTDFFRMVTSGDVLVTVGLGLAALLFVVGCATLPAIHRRLGPDYAVFSALMLLIPFLSTGDMIGMGRYFLAAFPVPVALALVLRHRVFVLRVTTAISALALMGMYSYYVRDFYLS